MKLLMEKGKQKELLQREKNKSNLSWKEFSKNLGIKFGTLWSSVYGYVSLDEKIFNKLSLKKEYEKYIIKKLPDNWGLVKGGQVSIGNTKQINTPKKSEELAEFWGILLGDGNINRTGGYKLGTYNINITGHRVLDKDYLLKIPKEIHTV